MKPNRAFSVKGKEFNQRGRFFDALEKKPPPKMIKRAVDVRGGEKRHKMMPRSVRHTSSRESRERAAAIAMVLWDPGPPGQPQRDLTRHWAEGPANLIILL